MKKLFLLALGAMVLASCSSNNSNSESQADSTAVQVEAPEAPETPAAPKVTDCPAFFLTGNVKSCTIKTNHLADGWAETETVNFDKNGKFTSHYTEYDTLMEGKDGYSFEYKDGRLSMVITHVKEYDVDIDWQYYYTDNRLSKYVMEGLEGEGTTTYTYADNSMTSVEESAGEGMCVKETLTYKYDSKDAQGNWTKATVTGQRAEWADGENENKADITEVKLSVERTITYW